MTRTRGLRVLVVVAILLVMVLAPMTASADKLCSDRDHYHYYGGMHWWAHHWVYMAHDYGDGEYTYWKKSEWNYDHWVSYNEYYGYLYCSG